MSIRELGVGILYNPSLSPLFESEPDAVDFVSVIPDMFWRDHGVGNDGRFEELPSWRKVMDRLAEVYPVVAHDIGLSLGSANRWDVEYLQKLAQWQDRYGFAWHSDHLSFVQIDSPSGGAHNAGMALPVPFDREVLEMVSRRTRRVGATLGVPFLVENGVAYAEIPDCDMSEGEFLAAMCEHGKCGLLLDLHNLYVDARNRGQDPHALLDRLDLSWVVEIHMAGGTELAGMYTDSHAGSSPDIVFELLDVAVKKARNLAALTFEFHDSYYPRLKLPGILRQLERMRASWGKRPEVTADLELSAERSPIELREEPGPESLEALQRALCDLIASPRSCVAVAEEPRRALLDYHLSERDQRRVATMVRSAGMRVNCTLYRMNRVTPIYSLLPRTCTALGDRLTGVLEAFWAASPDTDLQFSAESERFAAWLEHHVAGELQDRFVADVLAYERALNQIKFSSDAGLQPVVLRLEHDPRDVTAPPDATPTRAPAPRASPYYVMVGRDGDEVFTCEVPPPS